MLPTILTVNPMRKRHRRSKNRVHHRRHRKHVARRHHVKHHRRHHARRAREINPLSTSGITALAVPAVIGAAGAIGVDVALAYLPVPAALQTGYANLALKIAAAIGGGYLVGRFTSRRTGAAVAAGALTVYGYDALKQILSNTVGSSIKGLSGLADFQDFSSVGVGAYMARPGVGAYMNPAAMLTGPSGSAPGASLKAKQMAGLAAYMGRNRGG